MTESKLNKALFLDINKLKQCRKADAPVRFLLDKSPFNDDDDDEEVSCAASPKQYLIIGRILPQSDIFKEAAYQIEMKLTQSFPGDPPEFRFLTPIYHPNVAKDGAFCHELLKKTSKWKPSTSLVDVVKAVVNQIDHPDLDYSSSFELGKEYRDNRAEFDQKATEYVKKHGLPRV